MTRFRRSFALALAWFLLLGTAFALAPPSSPDYILRPGDQISITLLGDPPTTTGPDGITIPPDGRISFSWVKGVEAAGRSRAELEQALTEGIKKYILNPSLSVNLISSPYNIVTLNGALDKPGAIGYRVGMTIIEAIAIAGGPKDFASKKAVIFRKLDTGESPLLTVDLEALYNGDNTQNIRLQPGDIVIVSDAFISIDGRVKNPGHFPFRQSDTAPKAIAAAGGLLADPDLQDAFVRRGDRTIPVDLRSTVGGGASTESPFLLAPGDYLYIPPYRSRVAVIGNVGAPGLAFLIPKERDKVMEVLAYMGGPAPNSDLAKVLLRRHINSGNPVNMVLNIGPKGPPSDNVILEDGDVLVVPAKKGSNRTESIVDLSLFAQLFAVLRTL